MRHIVFVLSLVTTLLVASVAAGAQVGSAKDSTPKASADSRIIRLATVRTEVDSKILDELLNVFQKQTGYSVQVHVGQDIYEQAKAVKADLVLSHFRHKGLGAFVSDGFGLWPAPVMANVTAFVVPPGDPAGIRTLKDPIEIFRRIAETKSPFVVNGDPNTRYVIETLWNSAGQPDKKDWYIDTGVSRDDAAQLAAQKNAYSIWGVTAFARWQQTSRSQLGMVILNDSLMQRIMVCVVSNPRKFPKANVAGAKALQQFLLSPTTQAQIYAYRVPGINVPVFLPAGRNNEDPVVQSVTGGSNPSGAMKGKKRTRD